MNATQPQQSLTHFQQAYQQLYKKSPRDLIMLENDWVLVNGARIHVTQLDYMTQQLQTEYRQQLLQRRSVVNKLIGWLNKH